MCEIFWNTNANIGKTVICMRSINQSRLDKLECESNCFFICINIFMRLLERIFFFKQKIWTIFFEIQAGIFSPVKDQKRTLLGKFWKSHFSFFLYIFGSGAKHNFQLCHLVSGRLKKLKVKNLEKIGFLLDFSLYSVEV